MTRLIRAARRRSADQDGVILVLVAVGMVVFVAVAAVAIDLGIGYAASRKMQNAADAAALAGTQELECLKLSPAANTVGCQVFPAGAGDVATVVASVAQANGASASQLVCQVISGYIPATTPPYQVLGPCSDTASWSPYLNSPDDAGQEADGVYVESGTTEHAVFGAGAGVRALTQRRQAAASIQPLVGGGSPILACGYGQIDQSNGQAAPDLLVKTTSSWTGYAVNPAAIYDPSTQSPQYLLHGPQVDQCGLTSTSWKGLANESVSWSDLPGWLPIYTGDKAGPTGVAVADQDTCGSLSAATGCVIVLPICLVSNGYSGINGSLFCVGYGTFELLSTNSNTQVFGFVGLANASSGTTGTGNPDPNGVNVVSLIQ